MPLTAWLNTVLYSYISTEYSQRRSRCITLLCWVAATITPCTCPVYVWCVSVCMSRLWCRCSFWRPRTAGWTSCTRVLMQSALISRWFTAHLFHDQPEVDTPQKMKMLVEKNYPKHGEALCYFPIFPYFSPYLREQWITSICIKPRPQWSSARSVHIIEYISAAETSNVCDICLPVVSRTCRALRRLKLEHRRSTYSMSEVTQANTSERWCNFEIKRLKLDVSENEHVKLFFAHIFVRPSVWIWEL